MEGTKYISFDPWWGGFSNIRLSYELAASISVVTGRKLILPPKIYCLFLSEWDDKSSYFDIWDSLDYYSFIKEYDCVDYYDIPEYASLENNTQYFEGVDKIAKIFTFDNDTFKQHGTQKGFGNSQFLYNEILDESDFEEFKAGRDGGIDLNVDDKFIHFPRNLFGYFFYHIYGKNTAQRNNLREKVKRGIRYRTEFFQEAHKLKSIFPFYYNAIHVRRNDFLEVRKDAVEFQMGTLLDSLNRKITNDKPLYIATDETDKSVFDFLKDKYDIFFYDDLLPKRTDYQQLCIEQIICSEAHCFYGSQLSTYSHYVNILRGYSGYYNPYNVSLTFEEDEKTYKKFPWENEKYDWAKLWDCYWVPEKTGFTLGLYESHNSAAVIAKDDNVLEVIELEKWVNIKNAAFFLHFPIESPLETAKEICNYFFKKYNFNTFDKIYHNCGMMDLLKCFPHIKEEHVPHHVAHISNTLYQSDSIQTLNVSFDGGSDEGFFNIFIQNKFSVPECVYRGNIDLAVAYQTCAHYIDDIKREDNWWWGNLTYAGKVMGLSSYGDLDDTLISKFREFYNSQKTDNVNDAHQNFQRIFNVQEEGARLSGKTARNMARCNQFVFEEKFEEIVKPFLDKYPNRDLQFSGGGAMNILNNTKYDAFVSPNPDDRGMALGCLLYGIKPMNKLDSTYLGTEPFDELPEHNPYSIDDVVNDLLNLEIIGLIQGRCETGARALGNRSILCLPVAGMKDRLNNEVKRRESFRPFAPICRLEDAKKYFKFGNHSRWMNHNAIVRDEYKSELISITHNDGTARLQTITEEQNPFVYKLLTKLEERGKPAVLLNTSFNIQGKPILNRYKDALWMRDNTGLDKVITDKFILC